MEGASTANLESLLYAATRKLLTTRAWCQRVVEQLTPLSPDHCEVRTSYQLEIPADLLENGSELDPPDLPLVIPVCWLPKRALLGFDLCDEAGLALPVRTRRENAGIVGRVAFDDQTTRLVISRFDVNRLIAVAASSLGTWEQMREQSAAPDHDVAIDYLEKGTGIRVLPADAARLLEQGRELAKSIYDVLGLSGWWSRVEQDNPAVSGLLLAAYANPHVQSRQELVEWIDIHHALVADVREEARSRADARDWLTFYITAGVRWPVLITRWTEPGEVFLVKMREIRPSGHASVRKFVHETDLRSGVSYHLQVHTPDPSVVIAGTIRASAGPGEEVGFPETFETMRQTAELFTTYSKDERPDRVRFEVRFGLRSHVWASHVFAIAISVVAALVAGLVADLTPQKAAVLVIPTSLVAAFVANRESTLTARYLDWSRRVLLGISLVVWVLVIWRMLGWAWMVGG